MQKRSGKREISNQGTTVANCHFEQGTVHIHHSEHTASTITAIARALEENARALRQNAESIHTLARSLNYGSSEPFSKNEPAIFIGR